MTNTFIIYADTDDELEEKTLELISAMDYGKLNIKINIENNSDVITGFNTDDPNPDLPNNIIEFEDAEGNPMVIYYNTFDDVFSDMSLSDRVIYAEDYPRNTYINGLFKELGIETECIIEAYGEVVILTKKVSQEV